MRRNLIVRITVGTACLLLAASVFLGLLIRRLNIREFDRALRSKATTLATLVSREGRSIDIDFAGEHMPEFGRSKKAEYFEIRLPNGSVVERSATLGGQDLPFLPNAPGPFIVRDLRLPDGRWGRLVQIAFLPRVDEEAEPGISDDGDFRIPDTIAPESFSVVLSVARCREDLDDVILSVYFAFGTVDVFLILLIGLLVCRVMQKGFQPIAVMNAQIDGLRADALEKRIHLPETPVELQTVISALNGFMERLQAAFAHERRFTNDVAHELRTPIAEFRAACEVGAKWSDDPVLAHRRFEELIRSATNMERMVADLLELSRCDSGTIALSESNVHVAALVDSCWMRLRETSRPRNLRLKNRIAPALVLKTDSVKLEMILQNLLCNAVSYSDPGTEILCSSNVADGDVRITINNHTSSLALEDLDHIFERFWRKDSARTAGHHSGLGLSVVRSLSGILGIRLGVALEQGKVLTVSMTFPGGTGQ